LSIATPELHYPLLMAGRVEMTALTRKGQQKLLAAVFAFYTGKAVARVAAIEVPVIRDFPPGDSLGRSFCKPG